MSNLYKRSFSYSEMYELFTDFLTDHPTKNYSFNPKKKEYNWCNIYLTPVDKKYKNLILFVYDVFRTAKSPWKISVVLGMKKDLPKKDVTITALSKLDKNKLFEARNLTEKQFFKILDKPIEELIVEGKLEHL